VADIKRRCAAGIEKAKNVDVPDSKNPDAPRPMTIDSLELQYQGFCLIETLFKYDPSYLKQDNDVLRALRWLWRSKGRFLRMQHEESIPPRYQGESKILASFLVGYSKNSPDDVDLLFELIRIFFATSHKRLPFRRIVFEGYISKGAPEFSKTTNHGKIFRTYGWRKYRGNKITLFTTCDISNVICFF
jgi:hypothetical protein